MNLIRPIDLDKHLNQMVEIEKLCYTDNWDRKTFSRCLKQRNASGMVVVLEGRIAGYLIYEKYGKDYKIVNVTVDPGYQRKGYAKSMLDSLKKWLTEDGVIEAMVSDHNLDAHLFFSRQGFLADRVQRNCFKVDGAFEDGYHFTFAAEPATLSPDQLKNMVYNTHEKVAT